MDKIQKPPLRSLHAHIPAKTIKGRKMRKPWIDRKVRSAIRKKDQTIHKNKEDQKGTRPQEVQTMQRGHSKIRKTGILFIHKQHHRGK